MKLDSVLKPQFITCDFGDVSFLSLLDFLYHKMVAEHLLAHPDSGLLGTCDHCHMNWLHCNEDHREENKHKILILIKPLVKTEIPSLLEKFRENREDICFLVYTQKKWNEELR